MNIELFLILSAAYEYTREPNPHSENDTLRRYINVGIESYFQRFGYTYNSETKEWTTEAKKADTVRRRTQGAKDGWEIRRGKRRGRQ